MLRILKKKVVFETRFIHLTNIYSSLAMHRILCYVLRWIKKKMTRVLSLGFQELAASERDIKQGIQAATDVLHGAAPGLTRVIRTGT